MLHRLQNTKTLLGLDIGRSSIKAAQVTMLGKGPRLDGTLRIRRIAGDVSLSDDEADRLTRGLLRRGLCAKRVCLVAPRESVISANFPVPPPDSEVARGPIVKNEIARANRLPLNGFEHVWWDLPAGVTGNRINQAHAIALPHSAVMPSLETLADHGLEVAVTVPASVALMTAAQRRPIDPSCIVAVLDLGSDSAHLMLMHAGRVVHERTLPEFNAGALRGAVAEALGTPPGLTEYAFGRFGVQQDPSGSVESQTTSVLTGAVAELSEEVGMSFAYISHLYPEAELGPLLLVGGAGNIPGLTRLLSGALELETAILPPASLLLGECFGVEASDPAMTAALGAAMNEGGRS